MMIKKIDFFFICIYILKKKFMAEESKESKESNESKKNNKRGCFEANIDMNSIQCEFKQKDSLSNLEENLKDFISEYCGKVFTEMLEINHNSLDELFLTCLKKTWHIIPKNFYDILPSRPEIEYKDFNDFEKRFNQKDNYTKNLLSVLIEQYKYWMKLVMEDLKRNSENIVHYILFWGMTGEGKTTLILILSQIFNFINPNKDFGEIGIGTTGTKDVPDVLEAFFKHIKLLFQDIPGVADYSQATSDTQFNVHVSHTLEKLKKREDQHLDAICFVFDISKNRTLNDHENTLIHLAYAFKNNGSKIWDKVIFLFSQANREFAKDTDQISFSDNMAKNFDITNNKTVKIQTEITKCEFKNGKYIEVKKDILIDMPHDPLKRWFIQVCNYYKSKIELLESRRKLRIFTEFKSIIAKMFDNAKLYANEKFKNNDEKKKYIDTLIQGLYDRSVYTGYCYNKSTHVIDFGNKDFADGLIKSIPDTITEFPTFYYSKEILNSKEYKECKKIMEDLDGKLSKNWISDVIYQIINVSDPNLTLNLSSICVEEAVADNKKEEENKKKSTEKIPKDFKKSIPKKKLEEAASEAVKSKVESRKGTCMEVATKTITNIFYSKHTLPTSGGAAIGGAVGGAIAGGIIAGPIALGAVVGGAVVCGVSHGVSHYYNKKKNKKAKPKENKKEVEMKDKKSSP